MYVDKQGLKSTLSNDFIKKQAVLYMDKNGRVEKTSHFNLVLGTNTDQVDVYVRNMETT